MSRDKRNPVPEDNVDRFMGTVWSLVGPFGIDEVPEVYHYVELLGQAVERHAFERTHKMSPQKKVHADRSQFIAIFKQRYLQLTDLEYKRRITPVEGKMVHQVNKTLQKHGFESADYLKWLFEDYFLDEGREFVPPTLRQILADYFVHKFIVKNRELAVERRQVEVKRKDATDLANRARVLMRSEGVSSEDKKRLQESVKRYGSGDIMISEVRGLVEEIEKKIKD